MELLHQIFRSGTLIASITQGIAGGGMDNALYGNWHIPEEGPLIRPLLVARPPPAD